MFLFALKNMAIKKVQVILIVLSIVISGGVSILAYNVATQVSEGIRDNAGYYSVIVGPSGSQTQLAMNTMYFAEEPLGTIPFSVVSELSRDSRVTPISEGGIVPFAMADNYNGYKVVGTWEAFLNGKDLDRGRMFSRDENAPFEAVVGYNVAKYNDLKVGDVIYTSHSASGGDTHAQGIKVVGILEETHSSYDNVVFTQLETLWHMHDHGEDEGEEHGEHEGHSHGKTVCAVLVKTKNPTYAMQIVEEYKNKSVVAPDGDLVPVQAIEPMSVVRDILNETNDTKYIVFVLCAVILAMNIMIISIITLLNMYHSSKEISLMRLIGISMRRINLLYLIQNSIIGIISTALAFGVSRLCLVFMNDYVSSMGVVLNLGKAYGMEFLILGGIFLISVLPTVLWTFKMSRKDGIK